MCSMKSSYAKLDLSAPRVPTEQDERCLGEYARAAATIDAKAHIDALNSLRDITSVSAEFAAATSSRSPKSTQSL